MPGAGRGGRVRRDASTSLATALRGRRFRVDPGEDSVAAERGHLREAGNLVFHLSLLALLVARKALEQYQGTPYHAQLAAAFVQAPFTEDLHVVRSHLVATRRTGILAHHPGHRGGGRPVQEAPAVGDERRGVD